MPMPPFESFAALNAHLEQRCLKRMDAQLRGHTERIGQRMEGDLEDLLPLPAAPYDACDQRAGLVSSLSLVRYRTRDYSAPVAYGASGGAGKGLRGPGGHQLWIRRHRPAPPLLPAGRLRLRPHPLPAAAGKEVRGPWTRPPRCRDGSCPDGVCHAAPPPGVQDGTKGQAGVRPGAPAPRELQAGRGARPQCRTPSVWGR